MYVGRLKSIYITPTERNNGLNLIHATSLPEYVKMNRFEPTMWLDDEVLNAYATLCRAQTTEFVASSWVYSNLMAHYLGQKRLVSVEVLPCTGTHQICLVQISPVSSACPEKITRLSATQKEEAYVKALKNHWVPKASFIFPIHWANNHWFVVRGDRVAMRWEVYDSIPNEDATHIVVQVKCHHTGRIIANAHAEIAKVPVDTWS